MDPIENGDIPASYVSKYQGVFQWFKNSFKGLPADVGNTIFFFGGEKKDFAAKALVRYSPLDTMHLT